MVFSALGPPGCSCRSNFLMSFLCLLCFREMHSSTLCSCAPYTQQLHKVLECITITRHVLRCRRYYSWCTRTSISMLRTIKPHKNPSTC